MISQADQLDNCLTQLNQGNRGVFPELVQLLADHTIYAPVSLFVDLADGLGTKKAKVVTLVEGTRRLIPAFSSEERFTNWSRGEYQCLPMRTSDFVMTLPEGSTLLLDPGLPTEFEFNQHDLKPLIEAAFEGDDGMDDQREIAERSVPHPGVLPPISPEVRIEEVERSLSPILNDYPEIVEAYFVETRDDQGEMILGLLTDNLSLERRFVLITEVGEVSRRYYGYAGAIETYTDLHVPHSSSWELFRLDQPFYVRASSGSERPDTERPTHLDESVEQPGFSLWRMFKSRRPKL